MPKAKSSSQKVQISVSAPASLKSSTRSKNAKIPEKIARTVKKAPQKKISKSQKSASKTPSKSSKSSEKKSSKTRATPVTPLKINIKARSKVIQKKTKVVEKKGSKDKKVIKKSPIKIEKSKEVKTEAKTKVKDETTKPKTEPKSPAPTFGKKNLPEEQEAKSARPKGVKSAYIFFYEDMIKEMSCNDVVKSVKTAQKAQMIGKQWMTLTEENKAPYIELCEKDRKRYQKENEEFKVNGFFINSKGENSMDLYKPIYPDDVVQPKRPSTSFIFFNTAKFNEAKVENPGLSVAKISKKIGEQWGQLTAKEKEPYFQMQLKDKMRYEKESQQLRQKGYFINSDGIASTDLLKNGKPRQFPKDAVLPKNIMSPFIFFTKENFNSVRKNKEKTPEVARILGEKWKKLTSEEKKKYEVMKEKDAKRYAAQLESLKKYGFFMTEDGVKSTELAQKKTKKEQPVKKDEKSPLKIVSKKKI